jgi:hypothetical protein
LVAVDVVVPEALSAEEEDLLRQWAELRAETPVAPSRRKRRRAR